MKLTNHTRQLSATIEAVLPYLETEAKNPQPKHYTWALAYAQADKKIDATDRQALERYMRSLHYPYVTVLAWVEAKYPADFSRCSENRGVYYLEWFKAELQALKQGD